MELAPVVETKTKDENALVQFQSATSASVYTSDQHSSLIGSNDQDNLDMSVNKFYFILFVILINVNSFVCGYVPACSNQVEFIFNAKFGFITTDQKD